MSKQLSGNLQGLPPSQLKKLEKLAERKLSPELVISQDLSRELSSLSQELKRVVALLINRRGIVEQVVVGKHDIVYLPDLGRFRVSEGRLRSLRLIVADLKKGDQVTLSDDLIIDLQKLRFDLVAAVKPIKGQMRISYAWNLPKNIAREDSLLLSELHFVFTDWISDLESELVSKRVKVKSGAQNLAFLIGVYPKKSVDSKARMLELRELARTAGVEVVGTFVQYRNLDPKTLLGSGKLQEILLEAIRADAELLIFDTELSPKQWRSITNASELKVIDRSMLILDIFAQHATSRDGKLQVELAQLKYNLPKLVEKDTGLSRLTGGIGGRGPGETKLEVSRRYYRDRIRHLEKEIDKLSRQRKLRRKRRVSVPIPLVALVGYTNVGKSSLCNALTNSKIGVANKLFATLDPTGRQLFLGHSEEPKENYYQDQAILSDTVGFIRELPKELVNAFRATLEEIGEASLLLHVLDASDPNIAESFSTVNKQLDDAGFAELSRLNVINKIDLVAEDQVDAIAKEFNAIAVSVHEGRGLEGLRTAIKGALGA